MSQIKKPRFLSDESLKKEYRGKRVLVLGADGFMGVHAATALQLLGAEVSVVSRRRVSLLQSTGITIYSGHLLQKDLLAKALAGQEIVFDFAGSSGAVTSNRDAHRNLLCECEPHLNLFQCAANQPLPPLLVFCSTRTVYGKPERLPVSESHPLAPISAYAIQKLALEHYLQNFHKTCALKYIIFRLSNPYGPYLWQEKKDYGVINQFILRAFHQQSIHLFGDGSQLRDYIYIDDVVEAFVRASIAQVCHNQILNLGGPAPISIRDAVSTIIKHRPGSELCFEEWPHDYQATETGDYVTSTRKIKKLLPGLRQTSFARGVSRTLEAYERLAREGNTAVLEASTPAVNHQPRRAIPPSSARWAGRYVLVTGATGFIGGQLTARLLEMGAYVAAVSRRPLPPRLTAHPRILALQWDLEDPNQDLTDVQAFQPEVVFHFASCRDGAELAAHAVRCVDANIRGTVRLLELARRLSVSTFVYAGSAKVYGNSPVPHREDTPTDPGSSYAASKLAAWNYARFFSKLHGLRAVALRPTLIYGPGQINNLFTFLAKKIAAGNPEIMLDGGWQTRDPLYIDDALNCYLRAAELADRVAGRAIPIGGGHERTVQELAELFVRASGCLARVRTCEEKIRPMEMSRSYCDNKDVWEALRWVPEVSLADGLDRTLKSLFKHKMPSAVAGLTPAVDFAVLAGVQSGHKFGTSGIESCE